VTIRDNYFEIKKISNTDKAYIAGIMDGEGCFNMIKNPKRNSIHSARIMVVNTEMSMLSFLKDRYGGFVIESKSKMQKRYRWMWVLSNSNIDKFLHDILPYLVVKKEQAKIMIKFRKSKLRTKYKRNGISKYVFKMREILYQRLKDIKKENLICKNNV